MDGVQFIPKILLPLSIIKVSMVIKSLNMQTIKPENKNCFLGTKRSHNDVCKVSLLKNVFWSHGICLYLLIKYNRILNMFTKIMGNYECSLP